jgi:hypothetical protein
MTSAVSEVIEVGGSAALLSAVWLTVPADRAAVDPWVGRHFVRL